MGDLQKEMGALGVLVIVITVIVLVLITLVLLGCACIAVAKRIWPIYKPPVVPPAGPSRTGMYDRL